MADLLCRRISSAARAKYAECVNQQQYIFYRIILYRVVGMFTTSQERSLYSLFVCSPTRERGTRPGQDANSNARFDSNSIQYGSIASSIHAVPDRSRIYQVLQYTTVHYCFNNTITSGRHFPQPPPPLFPSLPKKKNTQTHIQQT